MAYIIKPLVTEKMTAITEKQNKFGFVVRPEANKEQIKAEVEVIYGVHVVAVNTVQACCVVVRMLSKRPL